MVPLFFRLKRLIPFMFAHWAADLAAVLTLVIIPLMQ
jgi:hypothetical protein